MKSNIQTEIAHRVDEAGEGLLKEAKALLHPGFNVDEQRSILPRIMQKETQDKNRMLLLVVTDLLLSGALDHLRTQPSELRNRFVDSPIRDQIQRMSAPEAHGFVLAPDPRVAAGATASAGVCIIGIAAGFFLPLRTLKAISIGLAALAALAYGAFKLGSAAASGTAREQLQRQVERYIAEWKATVSAWLEGVGNQFQSDFDHFCRQSGTANQAS